MFPEQIAEGLPVWKVTLEVRPARDNNVTGVVPLPINDVSPLWGKSYVDMGMEGHAQHRSQGTPSFFGNPFFRRPVSLVRENEKGDATGSFDPKLLAEPFVSLAESFPSQRGMLAPSLNQTSAHLEAARTAALALRRSDAATDLAEAAKEIAKLRDLVSKQNGNGSAQLLWELDRVREKIDLALNHDIALPMIVEADRHELVAGESFSVDVSFLGKPAVPVKYTVDASSLLVPKGWNATVDNGASDKSGGDKGDGDKNYKFKVEIPAGATPPSSPGDVNLPYPPPLVRIAPRVEIDGYSFAFAQTVESMKATTTGIDTYPLELVPDVTPTPDPWQIMVPAERAFATGHASCARPLSRNAAGERQRRSRRAGGLASAPGRVAPFRRPERRIDSFQFLSTWRSVDSLQRHSLGKRRSRRVSPASLRPDWANIRCGEIHYLARTDSLAAYA